MKQFALIIIPVFLICCNNQKDKKTNSGTVVQEEGLAPTFKSLHFNDKVEAVIMNFLAEDTCKECLHEMYVDKVRSDYMIIVLKSRPYSPDYLKKINPLFTTKLNRITFFVFTGLEDIIIGDKSKTLLVKGDSTSNNFKVWSIFIEADSLRVEKDIGLPFYPASPSKIKAKD